jgi:hypothetical protein
MEQIGDEDAAGLSNSAGHDERSPFGSEQVFSAIFAPSYFGIAATFSTFREVQFNELANA